MLVFLLLGKCGARLSPWSQAATFGVAAATREPAVPAAIEATGWFVFSAGAVVIGASRSSKMTSRQIVEIAGRRGSRDPGYASAVAGASHLGGPEAETGALAAGISEAR